MISSPVLDGYRLCHVRELIFNSTESLCLFGRGYETDYKKRTYADFWPVPCLSSWLILFATEGPVPVLTGIMQWI